jgi:geranylgeranyl reductase family protein
MKGIPEPQITILGSGPAGLTAAIFLGKNGVPVTLIDKDHFPRDKVCGDCLGGYALSVISQMGDETFDRFDSFAEKIECSGVHLFGPQHQQISIPAVNKVRNSMHEVVLSRRKDFDAFLLQEARRYPIIRFLNGIKITAIRKESSGYCLTDDNDFHHRTDMLIMATGSVRHLCRQLTGETVGKDHYATGIRTYFENVEGWNEKAFIELHFMKDLAPGYLWIFPLPGRIFNVGLGLRTTTLIRKKIDLKTYFTNLLRDDPYFKKRFAQANQLEETKGFPLALGGRFRPLSGDRYLLAGDAGHLIEPLFGEGIGHAMYSGKFAAEHVVMALEKNDFSATFNRFYDRKVYDKLGTALRFSQWMNSVARYPEVMRFLFNRVGHSKVLKEHVFSVINGHTPKTPMHGLGLISRLLIGR